MDLLTSSLAGLPANHSVSPASDEEWMMNVANWPLSSAELLTLLAPDGLSGKTSPAPCRLTAEKRLVPCSERFQKAGIASDGEYWTLSTSEHNHILGQSRSEGAVCSLSDILEPIGDHLSPFFLSQRACRGILRRADKRGRRLPEHLQLALEAVVG